jgi:hypothetical protein
MIISGGTRTAGDAAEVAQGQEQRDVGGHLRAAGDRALGEGLVGGVALLDAGGEVAGVDEGDLDVGVDLLQPARKNSDQCAVTSLRRTSWAVTAASRAACAASICSLAVWMAFSWALM